ncbi:MAG TPA: GntR family transcriptional regulator [Phycisphaerae bacterium]|nr:GntR family transcriptional regulator [Phycisphaerae bacterium]HOJ73596.1 GntR family transcriptional regulator [Phycisphaerae bacterium]HOM51595.1 GntR family transcriptional regulator [Phycisphaerae bacterium]HON65046.1 GntR family transcriptional regulator [Phycisphaerae bacterium]HOQ85228.1 GntR family transcriptional regulator [Phycisphaerae bacterium]
MSEALRRRLEEGQLAGGTKLPALKELASELSVSTMTVRRALRTLESEGHVYRIAGVGSFVRPAVGGRGLRRIAFIGSDLTSTFQVAIARGAQQAGQRDGWAVALLDAHWDVELEAANIRSLPEMGARGAIVLPPFSSTTTADALHALQANNFPMVLVDMGAPGLRADLVSSDHEAGAQLATRYLIERGHQRVFFLTHPPVASSVVSRLAGYEQALRRAGIEPRPEWKAWIDLTVHQEGYRQGRKWWGGCQAILPLLRDLREPVAVLAVDSYTGWGVYEACRQLGLRIPEDVSVIAFDDIEVAHAVSPPMTIVSQRTDEIGRVAVELLEKRIQSPAPRQSGQRQITQVLIDVDLIERQSVATLH